jgi:hypothetical protein
MWCRTYAKQDASVMPRWITRPPFFVSSASRHLLALVRQARSGRHSLSCLPSPTANQCLLLVLLVWRARATPPALVAATNHDGGR